MELTCLYAKDDQGRIIPAKVTEGADRLRITIPRADIPKDAKKLLVLDDAFTAEVGEEGYYAVCQDFERHSGFLTYFSDREDFDYYSERDIRLLGMFGVKKRSGSYAVVVSGMPYDAAFHMKKEGDTYHIGWAYDLEETELYEDIVIELLFAGDADYVGIAKRYREYRLTEGGCRPLRERMKERPELAYAKDSVEIRVRCGWKPAPPEIPEQTEENEPPMHVACTFDRVKDMVDELKRQGVEKAQLCLVGWNKSGHDGRWPTVFPVEPLLGGEEKLRELIAYAKEMGYRIVCHTNSTDCYSISDYFNGGEIVLKDKKGELVANQFWFSGGKMYTLCPQRAYEIAEEVLPKVRELGFEGVHYIDVLSIMAPKSCFDPVHPCHTGQGAEYICQTMKLAQELFGGLSSEGAQDYYAPYLDYGLYVGFSRERESFMDEGVPLWEIVYHGIIMANMGTNTMNYTIKTPLDRLHQIRGGGRPAFYFYSKFMNNGNNWMGEEDLITDTDEDLVRSVSMVRKGYEDYRKLCRLQTEFIEEHRKLAEQVSVTLYSDGTQIFVNESEEAYTTADGVVIPPLDYIEVRG